MMTFFAQSVDNVDATFIKQLALILVAVLVGAGGWAAWAERQDRKRRAEERKPEERGKRMSNVRMDVFQSELKRIDEKLLEHSEQLATLGALMRTEDDKIKTMVSSAIKDYEGVTERLGGTLEEVKNITSTLLKNALGE